MKADCHIHMVLDGFDWRNAIARHQNGVDKAFVHKSLGKYRELGYTYLRDGGDKWGVGAYARGVAPEYGITYRTPLAPISKRGHYGGFIGDQFGGLKEYASLVKQRKAQGADFIKIMISGLMDFDRFGVLTQEGLPQEEIREMIHIAKAEGFSVMVHANGARTVEAAALAGVHSVEHGAYLDSAALEAMQAAGTVWVPTLSTIGNLQGKGRFNETEVKKILANVLSNVSDFRQMGGLLAVGTDAGAWSVPHGSQTEEHWMACAGVDKSYLTQGNSVIMQLF